MLKMKTLAGEYNPELMVMLNGFSEWFMSQPEISELPIAGKPDPDEYYVSKEYLEKLQAMDYKVDKEASGYPNHTHGLDLMRFNDKLPEHMREPCKKINKQLNAWFGSKFCAVMMYYPPNGYMDWHNNGNCPGYNTLISYSHTGNGWFAYQDPEDRTFHVAADQKGWMVKVGYFGAFDEPDKLIWHCAGTKTHRITFGYVIPDEYMWNMMVDDITDA